MAPAPDAAPPPLPGAVKAGEEHRFPCRQCGADMRFSPGEGQLICDHCGATEPLSAATHRPVIAELDLRRALESQLPDAELQSARFSHCPNCGAEVEFDPALHSTECPFCATPVVIDTGEMRHIKPRGIAPFVLSEREARGEMARWLGRLWFAPNGLAAYARNGRALTGIYVPFWTYDAQTDSAYRGQRGTIYYTTEQVAVRDAQGHTRMQSRQVQHIRWTPVSGRVSRFFDDVLVLASRALPKRHTDALEPWDLTRLEPYQPEFLAGFRSEGYTLSLEDGMAEARARMDRMIERDVRFDIGGDRQQIDAIDTRLSDVTFKHILLPVWTAAYRYRGKSYRFVVNGQTGKVEGERPWSWVKIAFAVVLLAILIGTIAYFADKNGAGAAEFGF